MRIPISSYTLILFILKVSHKTLGKANRYSGAKSAPFSHSTVLYFTENLLKKFKSLRGSNTIPFSDDFKSTTLVTLLLNHNYAVIVNVFCFYNLNKHISQILN